MFTDMPAELVDKICAATVRSKDRITTAERATLKALRLVNRKCYAGASSILFKSITVQIDPGSIRRFYEVARSPLAHYIHAVRTEDSDYVFSGVYRYHTPGRGERRSICHSRSIPFEVGHELQESVVASFRNLARLREVNLEAPLCDLDPALFPIIVNAFVRKLTKHTMPRLTKLRYDHQLVTDQLGKEILSRGTGKIAVSQLHRNLDQIRELTLSHARLFQFFDPMLAKVLKDVLGPEPQGLRTLRIFGQYFNCRRNFPLITDEIFSSTISYLQLSYLVVSAPNLVRLLSQNQCSLTSLDLSSLHLTHGTWTAVFKAIEQLGPNFMHLKSMYLFHDDISNRRHYQHTGLFELIDCNAHKHLNPDEGAELMRLWRIMDDRRVKAGLWKTHAVCWRRRDHRFEPHSCFEDSEYGCVWDRKLFP